MKVRFFAAAAEAAGRDEQEAAASGTLGELLSALRQEHGAGFSKVLDRCAIRVDGAAVDEDHVLTSAATVDVLPPFAGG